MRRWRWLLPLLVAGLLGFLALPALSRALPDTVFARLPRPVQAWLAGPAPEALPAPATPAALVGRPPALVMPTAPGEPLPAPATPTLRPTDQAPLTPATVREAITTAPTMVSTASPTPPSTPAWPTAVRLTGINIVPQTFNNCGPANVSMVLNFYGVLLDQAATGEALKPTVADRNVSPDEIVAYVEAQTRLRAALYFGGDLDLLRRYLAAGYPVIVETGFLPPDEDWMGHYLTLVGYDDVAGVLVGMDTFLGPWGNQGREEPYAEFDARWSEFNRPLLVIHRQEQAEEVAAIAGKSLTDPIQMWTAAARWAETEVAASPEEAFAWFRLGSSLTQLSAVTGEARYAETAAAAFDQARTLGLPYRLLWYQFEPYAAYLAVGRSDDVLDLAEATLATRGGQTVEETYYYQGLALRQMGDEEGAQIAFARALGLRGHYAAALAAAAGD